VAGRLTLVATPIGNLGDLSPRAAQALAEAEAWFVEDSRVSGRLAAHLGLKKPMRLVTDHASEPALAKYAAELKGGLQAALVSDGGAPGVSDPGARLCDLCHDLDVEVDAVPGPSAVIDALMLSGFYAQRFAFLGFLARKPGPIRAEFAPFAESPLTLVLFESPMRLNALLKVAAETLGDRRYAVARELTKLHQQLWRARLPEIPTETQVPRKGELTLVIEGLRKRPV
jgi:16S rRNA (cytidine1402-2'-O)-methyltransferase